MYVNYQLPTVDTDYAEDLVFLSNLNESQYIYFLFLIYCLLWLLNSHQMLVGLENNLQLESRNLGNKVSINKTLDIWELLTLNCFSHITSDFIIILFLLCCRGFACRCGWKQENGKKLFLQFDTRTVHCIFCCITLPLINTCKCWGSATNIPIWIQILLSTKTNLLFCKLFFGFDKYMSIYKSIFLLLSLDIVFTISNGQNPRLYLKQESKAEPRLSSTPI